MASTSAAFAVALAVYPMLEAGALAAAVLALVALAAIGPRLPGAFEAALLGTAAAVPLLAFPWLLLRRDGR